MSLPDWCLMFHDSTVGLSSGIRMSQWRIQNSLDISTLEDKTTMLSWNTKHWSPSHMAPHSSRRETLCSILCTIIRWPLRFSDDKLGKKLSYIELNMVLWILMFFEQLFPNVFVLELCVGEMHLCTETSCCGTDKVMHDVLNSEREHLQN